jgi:hypothetical protein
MGPIMVGLEAGPLESGRPVFYFVCGLVGLFCVIALGYGPLLFVLIGAALAVYAFRRRFDSWWGLPTAASGAALIMAVALGWRWRTVVESFVAAFLLVFGARYALRVADRRSEPVRR